jgi:peroxiredoxin (alkyl hydroperoxide reductase subunit C)
MLSVGRQFPNFSLEGINKFNEFVTTDNDWLQDWSVVYFYPKDFTFICPTEIAGFDVLVNEGVSVIGISGDNEFCKLAWKQENDLIGNIQHTLAADTGLRLSSELGVVDEENGVCYRATFIIDPDGVIQHASSNALDTGRNPQEVLRTLKALQAGGLTGCAWNEGEEFAA